MRSLLIAMLILFPFLSPAQSINNIDMSTYSFNGKLLKAVYAPDCGIFSFEVAQKFEILTSNYPKTLDKAIFILLCPELHGRGFLKEGKIYTINSLKADKTKDISGTLNMFKSENLPTFWVSEIKLLKD